jgi:hypothetical protein
VWDVLEDVHELTGEIKFRITASPKDKHTFGDYDFFFSIRTLDDYLPLGGRIGLLGPNRFGGYASYVYGVNFTETTENNIIVFGPIVNIIKKEILTLSIFAGGGVQFEEYLSDIFYGSDAINDGFMMEGGFMLNLIHVNLTLGLETTADIYAFAGIGLTL